MSRVCYKESCNNITISMYCDECKIKNTKVFIIIGASGSGKSTFVQNRSNTGDLIIDFDLIFKAISGCKLYVKPKSLLPFVLEIKNLLISMIGDIENVRTAWIIINKFKDEEIKMLKNKFNAKVIEIRPKMSICKKRVLLDKNRPKDQINSWMSRIDEWFHCHPYYKPFSDEIITK